MSKKTETLEEFLARGGKITKGELVNDLSEIKKKIKHYGSEVESVSWKKIKTSNATGHCQFVGLGFMKKRLK